MIREPRVGDIYKQRVSHPIQTLGANPAVQPFLVLEAKPLEQRSVFRSTHEHELLVIYFPSMVKHHILWGCFERNSHVYEIIGEL